MPEIEKDKDEQRDLLTTELVDIISQQENGLSTYEQSYREAIQLAVRAIDLFGWRNSTKL